MWISKSYGPSILCFSIPSPPYPFLSCTFLMEPRFIWSWWSKGVTWNSMQFLFRFYVFALVMVLIMLNRLSERLLLNTWLLSTKEIAKELENPSKARNTYPPTWDTRRPELSDSPSLRTRENKPLKEPSPRLLTSPSESSLLELKLFGFFVSDAIM